jgi:sulfite reductase (NADPH) flavoprotein alpha-component
LAKRAKQFATEQGISSILKSMDDYKPRDLQTETNLLVIVSTHGEGEPPFAAKELHDFIFGKRAPKLDKLNFSVLSLGDSSYFKFCQTGKDFDEQLEHLGGKRIASRVDCDVDFQAKAEEWLRFTLPLYSGITKSQITEVAYETEGLNGAYSKNNPFHAEVLEKINLHGQGSERQTFHLELATDLPYEPGDAAGILPINSNVLVNQVLAVTGLNADEEIEFKGEKKSLFDVLKTEFELSKITNDVIKRFQEISKNEQLSSLFQRPTELQEFLYGRDIVDLFSEFHFKLSAQELVALLRPIQPRMYSISSSPKAVPGELHLTVGLVEYENLGRSKRGACSNYLFENDDEHAKIPLFIDKNPNFRLPKNDSTPIIMVGAGTGIAPYRAFVQQRELAENAGESWLFFGNRNFETEFLYQTEWQKYLKTGALTRMDVAFSRDTEKRIYVQHKLAENAAEIYRWLKNGAHFYICGDMTKMAHDVQNTLVSIVEQQGSFSNNEALEYVNQLQKEKRLQLDVY